MKTDLQVTHPQHEWNVFCLTQGKGVCGHIFSDYSFPFAGTQQPIPLAPEGLLIPRSRLGRIPEEGREKRCTVLQVELCPHSIGTTPVYFMASFIHSAFPRLYHFRLRVVSHTPPRPKCDPCIQCNRVSQRRIEPNSLRDMLVFKLWRERENCCIADCTNWFQKMVLFRKSKTRTLYCNVRKKGAEYLERGWFWAWSAAFKSTAVQRVNLVFSSSSASFFSLNERPECLVFPLPTPGGCCKDSLTAAFSFLQAINCQASWMTRCCIMRWEEGH